MFLMSMNGDWNLLNTCMQRNCSWSYDAWLNCKLIATLEQDCSTSISYRSILRVYGAAPETFKDSHKCGLSGPPWREGDAFCSILETGGDQLTYGLDVTKSVTVKLPSCNTLFDMCAYYKSRNDQVSQFRWPSKLELDNCLESYQWGRNSQSLGRQRAQSETGETRNPCTIWSKFQITQYQRRPQPLESAHYKQKSSSQKQESRDADDFPSICTEV